MKVWFLLLAVIIPGTASATSFSYTLDPDASIFYFDDYTQAGTTHKIDSLVHVTGGTFSADSTLGTVTIHATFAGITEADIGNWAFPGYVLPNFHKVGGSLDASVHFNGNYGVFDNETTGELAGIGPMVNATLNFNDGSSSAMFQHQTFGGYGFQDLGPGRIGAWTEWDGIFPNGDGFEWGGFFALTRSAPPVDPVTDPAAVPEPASIALLGLAGVARFHRRASLSQDKPAHTPTVEDSAGTHVNTELQTPGK